MAKIQNAKTQKNCLSAKKKVCNFYGPFFMLLTHIILQSDINNYNIRFLILECLFFVKLSYMKHIIITGASKGIGLELAKLFSIQNHKVIALSRNTSHLKSLSLDNVTCLDLDITKEEQNDILNNAIKNVFNNRVDILINNAGLLANTSFNTTSLDTFKSVYNTNVYGVVNMTQQALPYMNNKSHVVNISSMGGIQGSMKFAGLSAYSSSKGALITLTELLAEEYKETGPSFNVLALGAVQTEMLEQAFPGFQAPVTAEEMAEYIANFALTGQQFYNGKILQVSSTTP